MFKGLALRSKMIFGFGSVIVLLMVVSFVSWNAINGSSEGFQTYRGLARDTNLSGRLQANMLMVRMNVKDFIITGSDKDKEQYQSYMVKMNTFLEEARKEIQNPERASKIKEVSNAVLTYENGFNKVTQAKVLRDDEVNNVMNVKGPLMENSLTDILETADRDRDRVATFNSSLAIKHLLLARLYMSKFLDTNDQTAVDRTHAEFAKMEKYLVVLNNELQNRKRRSLLSIVRDSKAKYVQSFDKLVSIIKDRNNVITNTLDRLGPVIAGNVEDVKLSVKKEQDTLGPILQAKNQTAIFQILSMGGIAFVVGIIATWLLTSSITKPLKRIFQGLKTFSNTELEDVRERFENVIDDLTSGGENIASASVQLASGAAEQASATEETSSSLEEMSGMVSNNLENAEKAMSLSSTVNTTSTESNATMLSLQESMQEILVSNEKIEELVKVIGNIGEKTQIMDEIVFQTKLLSFNASVEAERAGEHGRGFAVVAQEVGNLAQMSGQSAQEIAEIVKESIKNAEQITQENKAKVQGGNKFVEVATGKLKEISAAAEELESGSKQVLSASQDQTKGIDQISKAMQQVDSATQENSASTEELSSQADAMKGSVNVLLEILRGSTNNAHPQISKASKAEVIDMKKFKSNAEPVKGVSAYPPVAKAVNDDSWERL